MMSRPASQRRGWAAGPVVCLVAAACGGARAVDDEVGPVADGPQPVEAVRFAPVGNVQVIGQVRGGEYDLELLFDQQVFGRSLAVGMNNPFVIREAMSKPDEGVLGKLAELRRRGEARLTRLKQVCGLSPEQQTAIGLALASDLNRVAGEIDSVRRTYVGQRIARQRLPLEQERIQSLQQDAARCRGLIERAFQQGSLVAAVGIGVLDPGQRRRLADWVAGRRATRWEAMVRIGLGRLDESLLGLSRRQHQAIVDLLLADVPPLKVLDDDRLIRDPTTFQGMLVLARLGRAGAREVQPLLDPRQWAELERLVAQAGPSEAVERMLVEQGILEAEITSAGEEIR